MRGVKKASDLTNILPSARARGILVPLIVRQNGSPTTYEIVAGKRRYHAALAVAQENDGIDPLPCAVMESGKVDGWVPRWMAFPPSVYTDRGGVGSVERWTDIVAWFHSTECEAEDAATASDAFAQAAKISCKPYLSRCRGLPVASGIFDFCPSRERSGVGAARPI